jgi:hypothetical protein
MTLGAKILPPILLSWCLWPAISEAASISIPVTAECEQEYRDYLDSFNPAQFTYDWYSFESTLSSHPEITSYVILNSEVIDTDTLKEYSIGPIHLCATTAKVTFDRTEQKYGERIFSYVELHEKRGSRSMYLKIHPDSVDIYFRPGNTPQEVLPPNLRRK